MRWHYLVLPLIAGFTLMSATCNSGGASGNCYRGRLEIKGICMNYTIRLLGTPDDSSLVQSEWTDEQTGKTYRNVFALSSPCQFPDNIKEGDEFYFEIDPAPNRDCNVCMAWYPTPEKKLAIRVKNECK